VCVCVCGMSIVRLILSSNSVGIPT